MPVMAPKTISQADILRIVEDYRFAIDGKINRAFFAGVMPNEPEKTVATAAQAEATVAIGTARLKEMRTNLERASINHFKAYAPPRFGFAGIPVIEIVDTYGTGRYETARFYGVHPIIKWLARFLPIDPWVEYRREIREPCPKPDARDRYGILMHAGRLFMTPQVRRDLMASVIGQVTS